MPTLWKRTGTLHPAFERFHGCLADDWFLLPHELELQAAHARALTAAGILTEEEERALTAALADLRAEYVDGATSGDAASGSATSDGPPRGAADEAEDIHTWIENELTARAGAAGRKIHTARSRNDQVATLLQLYLLDRAKSLGESLAALERDLAEQALRLRDVELPLQTHMQFAAPGSAGHWLLRHAFAFDRDRRHLAWLREDWRAECALGAGAVAGSSIPIDRALQASLLGFTAPAPNALDATGRRDELLQFLAWAAHAALHLQGLAADVLAFAQTPFGWLRPLAGLTTGSSMMPNKANPDAAELLRGEANALHGAHVQALTLLKGLPSGYNRDLQCLKPVVRDAAERLDGLVELARCIAQGIELDAERTTAALASGDVEATLRMERRVLGGEALRDAHHAEAGGGPATATERLGATEYRTAGSASPAEVRRTAEALLARLEN